MNAPAILAIVAGGLSVIALLKPQWPLVPVAVLLLSVAVVIMNWK